MPGLPTTIEWLGTSKFTKALGAMRTSSPIVTPPPYERIASDDDAVTEPWHALALSATNRANRATLEKNTVLAENGAAINRDARGM